jgi:GTP cyclohydrolase FolE2
LSENITCARWRERSLSLHIMERRKYAEDVVRNLIVGLKEKGYCARIFLSDGLLTFTRKAQSYRV